MNQKRTTLGPLRSLLRDPRIRRWENGDGQWVVYSVLDVISVLGDTREPAEQWQYLLRREPALAAVYHTMEVDGQGAVDVVDAAGVLRLAQSISGPRAEKLRKWMADNAVERLAEEDDPELAIVRTREAYARQGRGRRWIDQRLRAVSGRQALASEWYHRGATDGEHFRMLTNALTEAAFGMDVNAYRRLKGLTAASENLRDHMTDLELAMLSLAETAALALHQQRDSRTLDELLADVRDAGQIIAGARRELEGRAGRPVVQAVALGETRAA